MRLQNRSPQSVDLADRVKSIIESKGLSLHTVSQRSEIVFGHPSFYFVPHNFYYELRLGTFSPSLHQLFALSKISNYRFFDWLHVFGLDLEQIPSLQILLPNKRTILLESSLNDPCSWVRWFQNKAEKKTFAAVAPLSQFLQPAPAVRQRSLLEASRPNFLYAKVGREDAFAFPDLLPGSIVRANKALTDKSSDHLFLLEHSKGICCARLLRKNEQITVVSTHLPYAEIRLHLHREAKILGVIDLEIRRLAHNESPVVPTEFAKRWNPELVGRTARTISWFLRSARAKAGLALREASELSRQMANLLNDDRYFLSASSLSGYEAGEAIPKHFQKAIALCVSYAVPIRTFLGVIGISAENAGSDPIPDRFMIRPEPATADTGGHELEHEGFLGELMSRVGDLPLFLRHSINELSGLPSSSLHTAFWVGGISNPLHPYLSNALLISIDRHKKLPVDSTTRPPWQQLFYLVIKRDGNYLVGPCGLEDGALVMHPDTEHLNLREEFRNLRDAEVVGQVRALVRKL